MTTYGAIIEAVRDVEETRLVLPYSISARAGDLRAVGVPVPARFSDATIVIADCGPDGRSLRWRT